MKGAAYWQHVGRLEIGTYIDTDGRQRLAVSGECSIEQLEDVIRSLRVVTVCMQNAPDAGSDLHSQGVNK